jgi:membrane-associated phospholipid phosphatase
MLLDLFRKNKSFLIPYFAFLLLIFPCFIFQSKAEIHFYINHFNCLFTDYFFRYITSLGNGVTPFILGVALLFTSFRKAFIIATAPTVAGLLVQILKRFVFPDILRPSRLLGLHLVDGVRLYSSHSFPSGHSATIFALCFTLALLTKRSTLKFGLFFLALLVAFSRVYLSQHFLIDIYAGSVIGVLCVPFIKMLFEKIDAIWIDKSIQEIVSSFKSKRE